MNLPAEINMLQLLAARPERQRTASCLARLAGRTIGDTRVMLEDLAGRGTVAFDLQPGRRGRKIWRIAP